MIKYFIITLCIMISPAISQAGFFSGGEEPEGVGYLSKSNMTNVYASPDGQAVTATVGKDFPFVAFAGSDKWLGIMAAESIVNGRAHVRYWKNGLNDKDGENTAWVDLKDLERVPFDCCGDNAHCTGIKAPLFNSRTYTECFAKAMESSIARRTTVAGSGDTASSGAADLEKMKLQLEIEKLKLEKEIEKLKIEREIEQLKLEQERLKARPN